MNFKRQQIKEESINYFRARGKMQFTWKKLFRTIQQKNKIIIIVARLKKKKKTIINPGRLQYKCLHACLHGFFLNYSVYMGSSIESLNGSHGIFEFTKFFL